MLLMNIDNQKPVRVYFNLHKKVFSVQQKNERGSWIVRGYSSNIILKDAKFKVSQAGRARVLREKRKNVHAFVEGFVSEASIETPTRISYNPYKFAHFYTTKEEKVLSAGLVSLAIDSGKGKILADKLCVESTCKYPVTCKHNNDCMEKLVVEANKRRDYDS